MLTVQGSCGHEISKRRNSQAFNGSRMEREEAFWVLGLRTDKEHADIKYRIKYRIKANFKEM